MRIIHSLHWREKRKDRKNITDDLIEYCILHSKVIRDKHWDDAFNALLRMPQTGRVLKVVYVWTKKGNVSVITAFWIN